MDIVYRPSGAAAEYAPLACNIYKGCTFGCRYCYGPAAMRKSRQSYFAAAHPKHDAVERIRRDSLLINGGGEVLFSFIGDPYQPHEAEARLTRSALKIFCDAGAAFTVLTKGGRLVERDFDVMATAGARLGVSLVWCCDDENRRAWEPHAAPVRERMDLLIKAHLSGIRTWVSLEPVIVPEHALEVIRQMAAVVDFWQIGKLNHHKKIEDRVDWREFKDRARGLLEDAGTEYHFKKSLAGF